MPATALPIGAHVPQEDPIAEARARAYEAIAKIDWPGGFHRTDIGWRALEPR